MSTQNQKVVVISGASQGIGAALVAAYRSRGHAVVATSRTIAPSGDPDLITVRGDISEPATAEQVIAAGVERFGRIDTLISNAGIFLARPFTDYTRDEFATMVGVNLAGFFHLAQPAIDHMLTRGTGHVVTITSSLVDHAISHVPSALTSLTKGGLQSATKSLAIEYARHGIRVNAVSPGIIKTPMNPTEAHDALSGLIPVGRMGEPGDIVSAVTFLDDSPYITGEILHVDGGQSAGH
ncbi:SDR family oxidoreductase [Streptomyces sp. NPDC048290]|uniref:SDR family NAD(P)-dependent oxidoreductase n=1 Tax=Streptomyces sp. NPDC048290 TaxID=3155811 RepID=UPI0034202963